MSIQVVSGSKSDIKVASLNIGQNNMVLEVESLDMPTLSPIWSRDCFQAQVLLFSPMSNSARHSENKSEEAQGCGLLLK
jgi:hypothetical protein